MKTISLLLLGLAVLNSFSVSTTSKNTRVLSWTSQSEYINQTSAHFLDLMDSIRFQVNKFSNIKVEEGSSHLSLYNVTLSRVTPVTVEDGVFQYNEDCSSKFSFTKNIELSLTSDAVYFNGEYDNNTFTFSVYLVDLNLTRSKGPDTFRMIYDAEYVMSFGKFKFFGDLNITLFIDDVKEEIVSSLKYQDIDTIIQYATDRFSANDILTLDLNSDELPDNKSRKLILERSENGICNGNDTGIVEAFSAQISDFEYQSENVSFTFDPSKGKSSQIFYDINLLNELIKSKIVNGIFSFDITENNAKDYVSLGWTAYDLMSIFPNILYDVKSSNNYGLGCMISNAFSRMAAGRLVSVFDLNCHIVIIQQRKTWMEFTAQFLMDLNVENSADDLILQVDNAEIIDFHSGFTDIYYVNEIKKEISSAVNKYLSLDNFRLFKLSKTGYTYEYVDGKGILLHK